MRVGCRRRASSSIEDQVRLCREAARRFECAVPDGLVYVDVEISGAVGQRRGYQALLAAARNRRMDVILVEAQDRLWRNQGEMHSTLAGLRYWGVRVIAVTTGTDLTDRTGAILATVVGLKDEMFLQDLPGTPSGARLVARRRSRGQPRRSVSAKVPQAGTRCSQLSSTSSSIFVLSAATSASATV